MSETVPGRILAVDDDPSVRRFVHHLLTKAGHHVDQAEGVDEAVALFGRQDYDVALVDLDMPGRTGLDLLDEIRTGEIDVVPILLTGTSDVGAAVSGMKRGAFEYLPKPADPVTLRWTVARAVGMAHTRRRERVLESVVAEWGATFDACPDLMLVLNPDAQVVRANAGVVVRTGLSAAKLAGLRVEDAFPGILGDKVHELLSRVRDGETVPAVKQLDVPTGRHFLLSVSPIPATAGFIVIARDVSELASARQLQARLYRQLLTAQEDERSRIARELHDGIAQTLVSLAMGLGFAADATQPADGQTRLRELSQTANETLVEIRRMVQGLHPLVLDDLGLVAALKRLAETVTKSHGVRAELVVTAAPAERLPRGLEAALYRITQEALANVAKHASAKTVDVTLEVSGDAINLSIADDGCGFDPTASLHTAGGMGLSGLRERAERFGGTCRIDSHLGAGTTVTVEIPYAESSR
ncbi:response regulator [Limnoglobus roseus]|uniref:response regulator n=1 Tax=Limnoglobus roseus TaxID=2598579 RepID=UPI00143DA4C3|nr:response regulator [Limnoglobus roseus]